LEKIDPLVPTGRATISGRLYTLKERGWVSFEGYDPNAGRIGQQKYLRTTAGQQALEIDDRVRKQLPNIRVIEDF
jgi:hypothetical protein